MVKILWYRVVLWELLSTKMFYWHWAFVSLINLLKLKANAEKTVLWITPINTHNYMPHPGCLGNTGIWAEPVILKNWWHLHEQVHVDLNCCCPQSENMSLQYTHHNEPRHYPNHLIFARHSKEAHSNSVIRKQCQARFTATDMDCDELLPSAFPLLISLEWNWVFNTMLGKRI